MKHFVLGLGLVAAACSPKLGISETRMASAPPREATCALELVQADITAMSFNQTWEVLGYVTLLDKGVQDPSTEENRALVRPRACAMGGTSIAVAMTGANTARIGGTGSGVTYMVMRAKPAVAAAPTTF